MCSYKQTSLNEPCSITYPRGIRVQMSPADAADHLRLTCSTSCPLTAPLTSITWYKNRIIEGRHVDQQIVVTSTAAANAGFSCVIKGFEDLHSADVCAEDNNCWSLNCFNRRICALEGSSVNISNELSHPGTKSLKSKLWYKGNINSKQGQLDRRNMEYDDMKKQNILRLKNLKRNDSGEYTLSIWITNSELKLCDRTGVSLMVTGLTVTMTPSAEVTEGQRVTLTCSTSCPLTDNTNYMWYFNGRPLSQSKHLLLDPVSVQHAGNYSCAVNTHEHITSAAETLTVQSIARTWVTVATGIRAALVVFILVTAILCIGKKRISCQSPKNETLDNMEQPPQHQEQEQVPLAVISPISNSTAEHSDYEVDF
ncbi:sialoadhesin-like [Stegastes partitus]|uniref:Sialoadhesin-like n=1 Tax=Stegastes partitus TaxID=144197 RepID=A0A3B5AGA2_9TELE|nr:PREDICTED: sialoadhesin-like [Stegastes partitus]